MHESLYIAGNHVLISDKTCGRSPAKGASPQVFFFKEEWSAVNLSWFDGLIDPIVEMVKVYTWPDDSLKGIL